MTSEFYSQKSNVMKSLVVGSAYFGMAGLTTTAIIDMGSDNELRLFSTFMGVMTAISVGAGTYLITQGIGDLITGERDCLSSRVKKYFQENKNKKWVS